MKRYLMNILIAIDQLLFALVGGHPDETFSSACYRYRMKHKVWKVVYHFVNSLFFWQRDPKHCERAYRSEYERLHLPRNYRE